MKKSDFQMWLDKLGKTWVEKDPDAVLNLFDQTIKYFENVLDEPYIGKEKVYDLWKVVPENQRDISFDGEILMTKGNIAIANWKAKFTKIMSGEIEEIDGIFLFELNDEGKCILFKQWESVRILKQK
jgi:hypothetical protein